MVAKHKLILYLLLLFFCSSCSNYVPLRVKKNFTFCFNPATNYTNSKIQLNGYYVSVEPFERPHYDIKTGKQVSSTLDTLYTNMMFFSNGLVVTRFMGLYCGTCDIESNSQFLIDVSQNKVSETRAFYNGFNWGVYKIDGDTIKLQCVNHQYWPDSYWHLLEHWFLINADGSLVPIKVKDLIGNKVLNEEPIKPVYKFVETNIQLSPDTWLKNKEWFWCNKEKFKAWKKKNKK